MTLPMTIPSPDNGVWYLGDFPVRGYALCIIAGVIAAVWWGERRYVARGGRPGVVGDIAIWAVPAGIIGARAYHVATDYKKYFGAGGSPIEALYVWQGGLGIWGGVAGGALGALVYARREGLRMTALMDALAPALLLAQAIGRWGNWFNQELFGKPLDAWWALEIDPDKRPAGFEDSATFHPTYLYECVWNLGAAGLIVWADRKFRLGFGRAFALYVMTYCAGRGWIEALRIDPVQASDVFGLRLNVWTSIVLFLAALAYFIVVGRRHQGREDSVYLPGREPASGADEPIVMSGSEPGEQPDVSVPPDGDPDR